jgi:hypothetical protein
VYSFSFDQLGNGVIACKFDCPKVVACKATDELLFSLDGGLAEGFFAVVVGEPDETLPTG